VSSSTLQILNATLFDGRDYSCVASNEAGSDRRVATLIVDGN